VSVAGVIMLATYFMLVYFLAYFSNLKMEKTYFSEKSIDFQEIARRYIPEYVTFHNHHCENLNIC
jgi:hypothetical protein